MTVDVDWFKSKISFYQNNDDVFQDAFLRTIVLHGFKDEDVKIWPDTWEYLKNIGATSVHCITKSPSSDHIMPGPYAIVQGSLQEIWRLYEDTNGCFFTAVQPCQTTSSTHPVISGNGANVLAGLSFSLMLH